jgi:pimeloyl-ACP methyl ester carboxylesterase
MLRVDSGLRLPGEPAIQLAADVFLPDRVGSSPLALVCLPGGGMNRRYFDLQPEDGDRTFSFQAQMTAQGFIVITLDYPGIGDSDRPADGYALTHEVLAQACVRASGQILEGLRGGTLRAGVAAMPTLRSAGIGHSMGAMFTVLTQALGRPHCGIALLGFSTRGLPEYVPPAVREQASDSTALRAQLVTLARALFVSPYPIVKSTPQSAGIFAGSNAEPKAVSALKAAAAPLLPVPAYLSMVPGNVAPEAAAIDVPVFIGLGERDMAGPPADAPLAFQASPAVTLEILPETGHSHFLFRSRFQLFERLSRWLQAL